MSRLGFIKRHPRRSLSALATLLLAVGLVGGSGAFFQSTDANTGNTVSAGDIDLQAFGGEDNAGPNGRDWDARTCDPREAQNPAPNGDYFGCYNSLNNGPNAAVSNGAIFEITNIEPGQVVQKQARVAEAGSLDADVFLKLTNATGDADLFNALYVYVKNVTNGHTLVYEGPLNQLDDEWKAASGTDTLAEGESDVYEFAIKLPETGVDQSSLMNKSTTLEFTWLGRDQGAPGPNTVAP